MKRLIALTLMMTYMASAIGFTFSFHYCGSHFKNICFTSDTEKGCCGKNEHKTNCCKDKTITAKFKDNHVNAAKVFSSKVNIEHSINNCYLSITRRLIQSSSISISNDTSPPYCTNIPIYIKNRTFLI